MSRERIVIFLYNRLFDPLIQGNFWLYICDLLADADRDVRLHVVSYEDVRFPLTGDQLEQIARWQQNGLEWTPLKWHAGIGLKQKTLDLIAGFRTIVALRAKGYKCVITLGSVAGTFAYIYTVVLGLRLFLYQYEPHSEYATDNGMWSSHSLQTKISRVLERRAARRALVIASGTRFMRDRVKHVWKSPAVFLQIPTVVNDRKFKFEQGERDAVREEIGISDNRPILYYPGKFGGLYYGDETAFMFKWLLEEEPSLHFLIVTPHDDDEVHARFARAGVPRSAYSIRHSDYAEIQRYFFAADFAVIAVPPGPSKKFISNIKVGEYLCSGLPYLIVRGVSEDYLFAEENGVGVVVDDFSRPAIKAAWPEIRGYLESDRDVLRAHCRRHGVSYRGFDVLNPRFRAGISTLIGDVEQAAK